MCEYLECGQAAHALREDVERALQAGCAAYLSKPLDTRRFIDLVTGLLGKDAQPQRGIAGVR
jgi:CheY-like chemotaxis protein